jgi:hypothetical protein
MSGTRKDVENLATIDTFIATASNSLIQIIQGLGMRELLLSNQGLANWYKETIERWP